MRLAWSLMFALAVLLPAQNRRSSDVWDHLKKRYDKDGDGTITTKEYPRGEKGFKNLDRNGDGTITAADFERRGRRPGGRRTGGRERASGAEAARQLGDMYGSFINTDGKPGLTNAEWKKVIAKFEPGDDGVIPKDNLAKLLGKAGEGRMASFAAGRMVRLFDVDRDGQITVKELDELFTKMDADGDGTVEQGSEITMPPGVGEVAPDFDLPFMDDDKKTLKLSSHRGKRPVCLIFGSYT